MTVQEKVNLIYELINERIRLNAENNFSEENICFDKFTQLARELIPI